MAAANNDGLLKKNNAGMGPKKSVAFKKSKEEKSGSACFKRRKDCIKKKTMELSVLCGVNACVVIVGPDGKLETWPENSSDVLNLIRAFQKSGPKNPVSGGGRTVDGDWSLAKETLTSVYENQKLSSFGSSAGIEEQGSFILTDYHKEAEFGNFSTMTGADEEDAEFVAMIEDQLVEDDQSMSGKTHPSAHDYPKIETFGSSAAKEQGGVTLTRCLEHEEFRNFSAMLNEDDEEEGEGREFASMLEDFLDEEQSSPPVHENTEPMQSGRFAEMQEQEELGCSSTLLNSDEKESEAATRVENQWFPMLNSESEITRVGPDKKQLQEVDGWFNYKSYDEEKQPIITPEEEQSERCLSFLSDSGEANHVDLGMEFDNRWFDSDSEQFDWICFDDLQPLKMVA